MAWTNQELYHRRRREKYGPTGMSPEGRERLRTMLRAIARAKTHCKRGHEFAVHAVVRKGLRICVLCRSIRKRRKPAGLVPIGLTVAQYAAHRAWATRRSRYGPVGLTDEGRRRLAVATKRRLQRDGHHGSRKTHCKRGHLFSAANTRLYRGRRTCRACERLRNADRPAWCVAAGVRISILAHDRFYRKEMARLRRRMCDEHPDRGGTTQRFMAARKILDAFIKSERAWYAALELKPPRLTESQRSAVKRGWETRRRRNAA